MLYNAQRQHVADWSPGEISTCPECQQSLLARRGDIVVWHWAHHAHPGSHPPCFHQETAWHLAWKAAYDALPGWTVEQSIQGFRADAANLASGSVREFVHCLSPYYRTKHHCFAALRLDVRWIFDGDVFTSSRKRYVAKGGVSRFLTPRAYQLHQELRGRTWVHWAGELWKEWQDNVWFPRTDSAALRLLTAFHCIDAKVEKAG
jgi:hypothetical protein